MTEGKILRPILMFMIPLMIGQFFQQFYSMTDSVIIGNFVDGDALAAISASNQVVNLLIGFFIGLTAGMGVMIAQAHGAGDHKKLRIASNTSLFVCLIGGIIVTLAGFIFSNPLLLWMKTPNEIMEGATIYLNLYFAGAVFNIIYNMGASVLRAVGDSKSPLLVLVISSIVNIVLDLLFVLVFKWGIAGVGIATLIAQIVSAVCVVYLLMKTKESYGIRLNMIRYNKTVFADIIRLGVPSGMQHTIITVSNMFVQSNINGFGAAAMSGYSLYWRLDNFLMIPVNCLIMSATTFAGQNAGARKPIRIRKGMGVMLGIGNIYSVLIAALLFFFSHILFRIFTPDSEIIYYGVKQARMVTMGYCFISTFQIMLGFIRGMGHSVAPMMLSIVNMCLLRVIYLLTIVKAFPTMDAVNFSYPLTWATTLICTLVYYFMVRKKLYHNLEPKEPASYVKQKNSSPALDFLEKKVLFTGFEPFGGEDFNPAYEALKQLPEQISGYETIIEKLPTEFTLSGEKLKELIRLHKPTVVICVGQAGGRKAVTPERVAINVADADIPDNAGKQPDAEPVVEGAVAAYFSVLPIKEIVCALKQDGIPSEISNSAGTYVCNDLMYRLLHFMKKEGYPRFGGFIHVPYSENQIVGKPENTPFLPLGQITDALRIAAETTLAEMEN